MDTINLFDQIQKEILNMDLDSMVTLLNESFLCLDKLREQHPEIIQDTNKIFSKNICVLDEDSFNLLKLIFEINDVNSNNLSYFSNIQQKDVGNGDATTGGMLSKRRRQSNAQRTTTLKGGDPPTETALVTTGTQQVAATTGTQQVAAPAVAAPQAVGANHVALLNTIFSSNMTAEQQFELANKVIGMSQSAQATTTELANIRANSEKFELRFKKVGILCSFGAPAALCYFAQGLLTDAATTIIGLAGTGLSVVVGPIETGIRYASGGIFGAIAHVGNKWIGGGLFDRIANLGGTIGAGDHILSESIEKMVQQIQSNAGTVILFANIIIYIISVITLSLLIFLVIMLYTSNDWGVKFSIRGPSVWLQKSKTGGRKTKKHRKKKAKRKYTYRHR